MGSGNGRNLRRAGAALVGAALTLNSIGTAAAQTGVSGGQTYTVSYVDSDGATPSGLGRWTAQVGEISGGDPAVVTAFNEASHASMRWQVDQVGSGPDGVEWRNGITSEVQFGSATVSELLTGLFYAQGAAHPTSCVSTVVIDSRTARPITLADLFVDEPAGLNRLSEQTVIGMTRLTGVDATGLPGAQPTEDNFVNWLPTADGMELHFADYQFAHGLPVITIPWSALSDLLTPDMLALTKG